MAVINPHTTRGTGTVLTATIYNADHQNHITNANNLNAELGAIVGVGAATGIIVSNGAGVISGRTLTGTANQITVSNGNGLAGNPVLSIPTNPILPGNASSSGTFTAGGQINGSQNFASTTAVVVLATGAAGNIFLRPGGIGVTSSQVQIASTGNVTIAGDVIAAQNIRSSTNTVVVATSAAGGTGVLLRPQGVGSTTGQLVVASNGNTTVNGTLTVTG